MSMRRKEGSRIGVSILFCGLFLFLITHPLFAQDYPSRPINILVTVQAGGAIDVGIRPLASSVEKSIGQPFIISNNAGGAGSVALGIISRAKPDGYHLMAATSTPLLRLPHMMDVPYKLDDFVPIMTYGAPQSGIVVRSDAPWKTLKELVDYAKKNPGKINYSTTGVGQPMHVAMEFIARQEGGIKWNLVPSPGVLPHVLLLGGHVDVSSSGSQWASNVKDGSLRILATHGWRRMKNFPDAPTLRECGYDYFGEVIAFLAGPKGTPLSIVRRLDDAFRKAMENSPEFTRAMDSMDSEIFYRNAEETKKYLEEAYTRVAKEIIDLNIPREAGKK
jgi:tripartite-type tricarboxylate transporter receptor subunit TctC